MSRMTVWLWRSVAIIVLVAVAIEIHGIHNLSLAPAVTQRAITVNAQVAGNGGAENSMVLYWREQPINSGGPNCPSGWTLALNGYGPHYFGLLSYDWNNYGTGGIGGGVGDSSNWTNWPPTGIGGPGAACFTGDTPIRLSGNESKLIEKVEVGDTVTAFDELGSLVEVPVLAVHRRVTTTTVLLSAGGREVVTTPDHPFSVGAGVFKEVRDLAVGEEVYLLDDEGSVLRPVIITKLEYRPGEKEVFTLSVAEPNTFIAGGFAVHNKVVKGPPMPPPPPPTGGSSGSAQEPGDPEDARSYKSTDIDIISDSICSQNQQSVIPIVALYQNSITANTATWYADACSTDSFTGLRECNRCIVCIK